MPFGFHGKVVLKGGGKTHLRVASRIMVVAFRVEKCDQFQPQGGAREIIGGRFQKSPPSKSTLDVNSKNQNRCEVKECVFSGDTVLVF